MDFGFYVPTRGPLSTPDNMKALVAKGEELGFGYIAISDHVVVPRSVESTYPYSDGGDWPAGRDGEFFEQLSVMAYLAGQTTSARLLTSVMVLPHRAPVLTAKMLSTIGVLSSGRVTVGAGAGWCKEEFEAIGAPFHAERGKVADEYIRVFKELWTNKDPEFHGAYADFADITFMPRPVQQPGPPIWIGSEGKAALRRVIRVGDGWYPTANNPKFPLDTLDRYKARLGDLRGLADEGGHNFDDLQLGLFIQGWGYEPGDPLLPRDKDGPVPNDNRCLMSGSAEQMATDIESLKDLGVTALILGFERSSLSETMDGMEAFVQDIL